MYYYSTIRLILIYRPSEGGRLSRPRHFSKCAAYAQSCESQRFSWKKTKTFVRSVSSILGPLAPQESVLPLDHHCNLRLVRTRSVSSVCALLVAFFCLVLSIAILFNFVCSFTVLCSYVSHAYMYAACTIQSINHEFLEWPKFLKHS